MGEKITVLIASYNPNLIKLKKTIISIILQKGVDIEIIISDDGSNNNYFKEIDSLFHKYDFDNYKLVESKNNQGTCKNILKGLFESSGLYIKIISPGDFFYNEHVLKKWIDFMQSSSAKVCFGNSIYYNLKENTINIMKTVENPQLCILFDNKMYAQKYRVLDYIFLKDVPNGACFMATKDLMVDYIKRIENKIVYAEDMIYSMMISDGIEIIHFDSPVVWYEYGSGISTSRESKWDKIIANERIVINKMIIGHNNWHGFNKKRLKLGLQCINNDKYNFVKYIIFPELIYLKIKKNRTKRYSITSVNDDFYKLL